MGGPTQIPPGGPGTRAGAGAGALAGAGEGAGRVAGQPERPVQGRAPVSGAGGGFHQVLQQSLQGRTPLKISAHAQDRLSESRRALSARDMERLAGAMDQAAARGARQSLVLMQDLALVVSVPNRTVITALDGQRMKENIFTNIDSAVIL